MRKRKASKSAINLQIVPAPAEVRLGGLSPEQADELRELIREIKSKALEKPEKRRKDEPHRHTEHDPDLPPAV